MSSKSHWSELGQQCARMAAMRFRCLRLSATGLTLVLLSLVVVLFVLLLEHCNRLRLDQLQLSTEVLAVGAMCGLLPIKLCAQGCDLLCELALREEELVRQLHVEVLELDAVRAIP